MTANCTLYALYDYAPVANSWCSVNAATSCNCELRDIAGTSVKSDEVPLRQANSRYSNMC